MPLQPVSLYIQPTAAGFYANVSNMQVDSDGDVTSISTGNGNVFSGYDIIIAAGQSNNSSPSNTGDPNIDFLRDYTGRSIMWDTSGNNSGAENGPIAAGDPLLILGGWASTGSGQAGTPLVPPVMSMVRAYCDQYLQPTRKVIVVVTAVPSTGLTNPANWSVGNTQYNNCITNANAAMAYGPIPTGNRIVFMTWVQGEADAQSSVNGTTYFNALVAMLAGFRTNITGAANMPFVISSIVYGSMGAGFTGSGSAQVQGIQFNINGASLTWSGAAIDAAQRQFTQIVPFSAYGAGTNTTTGAQLHYSAVDQRLIGRLVQPSVWKVAQANSQPFGGTTTVISDVITVTLTSTGSTTGFKVNWTTPQTGTASPFTYEVVYWDAAGASTTYSVVNATSSPVVLTGLTVGHTYRVYVLPHNAMGAGPNSAVGNFVPSGGDYLTNLVSRIQYTATQMLQTASGGGTPTIGFGTFTLVADPNRLNHVVLDSANNNNLLNITGGTNAMPVGDWSFCTWFAYRDTGAHNYVLGASQTFRASSNDFFLTTNIGVGVVGMDYGTGNDNHTFGTPPLPTLVGLSPWYHYVVTYVLATLTATVYINGAQVASGSTQIMSNPHSGLSSLAMFNIPAHNTGLSGRMDDTRYYSSALTALQITQIYENS